MASLLSPRVQDVIDRCLERDRRHPSHDPMRAEAAYRRRLAATGLARRVRWLADPVEILEWRISADRTARAMRMAALLGPASARDPLASAQLEQLVAPRGWSASRDLAAMGGPPPSSAALDAWQSAQGWADEAIIRCGGHWDAGCMLSANLWASLANSLADRLAALPTLAWLAGPEAPGPALPLLPTGPLAAWTRMAGGFTPVAWAVWQGVTGKDAGLALGLLDRPASERLLRAYEPMIEAFEAGAFAHSLLEQTLLVLAAPAVWTDGRRLHREDGPAVEWPRTKVYAWKGVVVPEHVIMRRDRISPRTIRAERNQEVRGALIDMFGVGRYLRETDAAVVHEDETGRLWHLKAERSADWPLDEVMAVEVRNGTAEPDGTRRTYWLNVPPHMTTAKEAVSWTYALTPEEYDGLVERS